MIAPALRRMARPVGDLTPHPRNARQGDVGAISQSLERFGQVRPIVVQKATGYVVAGNHVLAAARALGWPKVAAVEVDLSDQEAIAYLVADNRIADLGSYDDQGIADLLGELAAEDLLGGTGYDAEDYGRLLADLARDNGHAGGDGDQAPDLPTEPKSRLGEVYDLGPHRLVCGDACDHAVLLDLLAGEAAKAMWTDPPYGVDYVGKTADALTMVNDRAGGLLALLHDAFAAADGALAAGSPIYVAHPAGALHRTFLDAFEGTGWKFRQGLVWDKGVMVLGHADYHYAHEPILYGNKPGGGRRGRGGRGWYGDNSQTSIFRVPKPSRSETHPTMKPVELVRQMLANSLPPNGTVLDPFAGAGTTLVAAHTLGQRAALVEIDPAYCDVIRQRYADLVDDQSFAPS